MGYKRDIPILPLICEMTQHRKFVQFAWQDRRQDHWPYFVFFATSYRIGTHATTTDPNSIVMLLGLGSASIALWQIFEHPTNAMAHFRTSDQCDVKFSIIGTNAMADFQTSGRMLAQIFKNRDQCYGRFANIRNLRDRLRNRVKVQDEINVEDSCMVTTVTTTIATNGVMINSGGGLESHVDPCRPRPLYQQLSDIGSAHILCADFLQRRNFPFQHQGVAVDVAMSHAVIIWGVLTHTRTTSKLPRSQSQIFRSSATLLLCEQDRRSNSWGV